MHRAVGQLRRAPGRDRPVAPRRVQERAGRRAAGVGEPHLAAPGAEAARAARPRCAARRARRRRARGPTARARAAGRARSTSTRASRAARRCARRWRPSSRPPRATSRSPAPARRPAPRRCSAARARSPARACAPRAARGRRSCARARASSATARPSTAGTPRGRTPPRRAAPRRRAGAAAAGRGRRSGTTSSTRSLMDVVVSISSLDRIRESRASTWRAAPACRSRPSRWCCPASPPAGSPRAPRRPCAQAAEELGYRPNVAARTLRTGTARTVGLVVTDVTHPFFGPVLRGAQAAAWRADYAVTLVDVANDPDRERGVVRGAARRARPTGTCSSRSTRRSAPASTSWRSRSSPPGMPFVRFDTERGTDLAVRHLLDLGHTRIGHLGSVLDAETFRLRRERVLAMLAEAGLEPCRLRAGRVPVRRRPPRRARLLDAARPADRGLLRRRPAGRRRLPGGARPRPADPRGRLGRRLRRPPVRAGLLAAADHDRDRPGGARRRGVRGAGGR